MFTLTSKKEFSVKEIHAIRHLIFKHTGGYLVSDEEAILLLRLTEKIIEYYLVDFFVQSLNVKTVVPDKPYIKAMRRKFT